MKRLIFMIMLPGAVLASWVAPIEPEEVVKTNKVEVIEEVTEPATSVTINSIHVRIRDGRALIYVSWEWLDDKGKSIRRGTNRYTEEDLDVLLEGKGLSVAQLRVLFMGLASQEANHPIELN